VLIAALAAAGLAAGPVLRWLIVRLSVPSGEPWRRSCPGCGDPLPPARRTAAFAPRPQTALTAPGRRTALTAPGRLRALPVLPPGGRCRACRARLGPPALTVEVTAAVVLGLLAARIHPGLVLAAMCWLALCTIPLAYIDAATRRLPDLLTGPAFAGTAALLVAAAAAGGHWSALGRAVLGGAAFAAFCLVLLLISPSGMGAGDVKLAASLGTALAWLGWGALAAGALAGFVLGAGYGAALLVARRASRATQLPFGPFLIAGTFLVLLIAGLG